jgi:hypothetical protein
MLKEAVVAYFKMPYYTSSYLEKLGKSTKILRIASRQAEIRIQDLQDAGTKQLTALFGE